MFSVVCIHFNLSNHIKNRGQENVYKRQCTYSIDKNNLEFNK
jgi:hypothetical protein